MRSIGYVETEGESEEWIRTLINHARRNVHVHSVIYYHLNDNLISDYNFDKLSKRIKYLNETHPDIAKTCYRHDLFKDWEGHTGAFLPVDTWPLQKAQQLVAAHRKSLI